MKPTTLSLRGANLLFFITMLLVITLGSLVQTLNLSLGLIATELLLILTPALLWLRARKVPLRAGLRLRALPRLTAVLCVALGFGTYLFSAVIEGVMAQLTGKASVPMPEGSLPTGALESILFFIALGIAAPLCEEALFRGAIQGAYEARRSPRFAILITATMFIFYHFRLSGLPALLPVALILGYVVWRTGSLYAGMLVHFGVNGTSAANTLAALQGSPNGLGLVTLWSALGGLVAAGVILFAIHRLHRRPIGELASEAPVPQGDGEALIPQGDGEAPQVAAGKPGNQGGSRLSIYWPLIAAGLLYLVVVGLSQGVTGEATSLKPQELLKVKYFPPRIDRTIESTYQIINRAGDVVGRMTCQITPQSSEFRVDCEREVQGFELRTLHSYYLEVDHTATWSATWNARTLDLQAFKFERKSVTGGGFSAALSESTAGVNGGQTLNVNSPNGGGTLELSEPFLLAYEWVWRAAALQANTGERYQVPFGRLLLWNEQQQKTLPVLSQEILTVGAFETLNLPAGQFEARKMSVAGQSTWYAVVDNNIPRLVQWDDGALIYMLEK